VISSAQISRAENSLRVRLQKKAAEKNAAEAAKKTVIQVDDLLTFRQFSKKTADDIIDVSRSLAVHLCQLINASPGT
jgi:pyrimidine operon attenuation protein/uracil phosphoribosyltransferase